MNQYKPIPSFEKFYSISKDGEIMSYNFSKKHGGKPHILKPWVIENSVNRIKSTKYLAVQLYDESGNKHRFLVHRLVAITYLGNKDGLQVDHIDGNGLNNNVKNLRWVTGSENIRAAFAIRNFSPNGENSGRSKLTEAQVRDIFFLKGKQSSRKVAKKFGVGHALVLSIWNGKSWKHLNLVGRDE